MVVSCLFPLARTAVAIPVSMSLLFNIVALIRTTIALKQHGQVSTLLAYKRFAIKLPKYQCEKIEWH